MSLRKKPVARGKPIGKKQPVGKKQPAGKKFPAKKAAPVPDSEEENDSDDGMDEDFVSFNRKNKDDDDDDDEEEVFNLNLKDDSDEEVGTSFLLLYTRRNMRGMILKCQQLHDSYDCIICQINSHYLDPSFFSFFACCYFILL